MSTALCGVAAIGVVPYAKKQYACDRADIARAMAPLLKVALDELPTDRELPLTVDIPGDVQWRRISSRLGAQRLRLVVGSDPAAARRNVYDVPSVVNVHAIQGRMSLALEATNHVPFGYAAEDRSTSYGVPAAGTEPVQLLVERSVERSADRLREVAFLMVFAEWNPIEVWHWGDSLSMGEGYFDLVAPLFVVGGICLIALAGFFALIPGP